tara:strand:+ start:3061 stop:3666 length:606 start_codon:yes stop_codon:yes gene_type:complete
MKSIFDFIVKPLGEKYNNTVKIGNQELVVNTKIESFKFVNRFAEVVETPIAFYTDIKKGDIIIIHQNVFRTFYDMKGAKKVSRSFFQDDLFFVSIDQVYMYKNNERWNTFNNRCFIQPIQNNDDLTINKERALVGILKYGNSSLKSLEITPGDVVGFVPTREWEFLIDGERLYCMESNDIVIKYDKQGDEIKYNPSWAEGS